MAWIHTLEDDMVFVDMESLMYRTLYCDPPYFIRSIEIEHFYLGVLLNFGLQYVVTHFS